MPSLKDLYDDCVQLAEMNHKKRGAPFKYTEGVIFALAALRCAR